VKSNVSQLGIIPEMFCREFELDSFYLELFNSVFGQRGQLMTWLDFVRVMNVLVRRQGNINDATDFFIKVRSVVTSIDCKYKVQV
jgi:hypothetical protein